MVDIFEHHPSDLDSPGSGHYAITPHDSNNETIAFRAVYVGVTGHVAVVSLDGDAVLYKNAVQGSYIVMRGIRVNSTLTTATDLVGVY